MSTTSEDLHRVIGIDLGTTYSAVAVYSNFSEQAEIIKNPEDPKTGSSTPSVISFDRARAKVIVGQFAKQNSAADPNTVIEVKREMGEFFRPETLLKFDPTGMGGFEARSDGPQGSQGDPVKVRFCGEWYLPQEMSAFTLMKLKEFASANIGCDIVDAVVTVPAYFTEKQKKATEEAARLAGLYPRQLVPEPTAAAICYGVDQYEETRKVYLVYDLGGGTFDVSIITVKEADIAVIATSGDARLGGGDFDDAITKWAVEQLASQYQMDISADHRAQAIVKYHAEQLKQELSTFKSGKMVLMELRPQDPPTLELTREKFESLIEPYLNKSLNFVDTAIKASTEKQEIGRDDIDAILLVGGSSKIPLIKAKLLDHFGQDEDFVRADLDPDAVVARGAAILAKRYKPSDPPFDITRKLDDADDEEDDELNVHLITEHSLGIGVNEDEFARIISQGQNIPVAVPRGGFTNGGPYEYVDVHVYQGEGDHVYENELIGVVPLGPMEAKPEGHHKFEVTFSLDRNGLLSAIVNHLNEGQTYRAKFQQKTGIGGDDALGLVRKKLLEMYEGTPPALVQPTDEPAKQGETNVPERQAPGVDVPPATQPADVPPATQPATEIPPTTQPVAEVPPATQPATDVPPNDAAVPESHAHTEAAMPKAEGPIPEQFKRIVRRAEKLLTESPEPKLRDALAAFLTCLNSGASGETLEDLGDELEDVYFECRSSTAG